MSDRIANLYLRCQRNYACIFSIFRRYYPLYREKVRSRTPMKPSALAAAPATSQPQPAPLLAPQRTPVSPSHLPTPAPPRRPSAPPAPPPSSTASLPRSPRSSSHPPAQQPAHNPTTPPREHRTIHSIPAALTHCHASPRGAQEPSPHGCFWPWRSEEGAREAKMANSCVHARTAPPRRAPLPAPPVHADAPCSPFHPPAPPQPPPPAPTAGPSFMGLRSLFASWHIPCKHSCNAAHICNAAHMQCSTSCGQRCCCWGLVLRPAIAGLGWALPLKMDARKG